MTQHAAPRSHVEKSLTAGWTPSHYTAYMVAPVILVQWPTQTVRKKNK